MSGPDQVAFVVIPVVFAALGAVIRARRPENRVAWIFFWLSAGSLLEAFAALPDLSHAGEPSFSLWFAAVWSNVGLFVTLLAPISLILFLFPTGRFLTPRWVWGGWAAGLLVLIPVLGTTFAEEVGPPQEVANWKIENPIGFVPVEAVNGEGPVALVFGVTLASLVVGGVASMIIRYRRASAVVRAQIKWVAYSGFLFIAWFVATVLNEDLWADASLLSNLVFVLVLGSIPVSVTVAITRYRLFEIERIISRTVGYGAVIGILALVYTVGAVWLPGRLIGEQPPVFVATTTLLTAALFAPVRRRVLDRVDRRFYRSRYDAERVMKRFLEGLRTETDPGTVGGNLERVVVETVRPTSLGLWVKHSIPGDSNNRSVG